MKFGNEGAGGHFASVRTDRHTENDRFATDYLYIGQLLILQICSQADSIF